LRVGGLAIGGPDSTLGKIPVAAREVWSPRKNPLQGRINPVLFSASPGRPRTIRRKSGERCHPVSAPLGHRSVVRVASVSPAGPAGRDGKIRARSPIDILSGTRSRSLRPGGYPGGGDAPDHSQVARLGGACGPLPRPDGASLLRYGRGSGHSGALRPAPKERTGSARAAVCTGRRRVLTPHGQHALAGHLRPLRRPARAQEATRANMP
jgi:hypothetical protein